MAKWEAFEGTDGVLFLIYTKIEQTSVGYNRILINFEHHNTKKKMKKTKAHASF